MDTLTGLQVLAALFAVGVVAFLVVRSNKRRKPTGKSGGPPKSGDNPPKLPH